MIEIRQLAGPDAAASRELRLQALRESPTAFGSSHAQEANRDLEFFAERLGTTPDRWILGAFAGGVLAGVVGFVRDAGDKTRHKGLAWGMYVHPGHRGQGIGRKLMAAARRLYESLGFVRYGHEPEALRVEGVYYDEYHLIRRTGGIARVATGES